MVCTALTMTAMKRLSRVSVWLSVVNEGFAHTAPKAQGMAYQLEASYSKPSVGESYGLSFIMSRVSTHKKVMSKKQ